MAAQGYSNLVAALRYCLDGGTYKNCMLCGYKKEHPNEYCLERIMTDAADAIVALGLDNEDYEHENRRLHGEIEALQAEVTRLQKEVEFSESSYDEFSMQAAVQNALLAGKLPKRGKWVGVSPMVDTVQCSICGGQLFSAELETPYCPYCGAEMIGEQNEEDGGLDGQE